MTVGFSVTTMPTDTTIAIVRGRLKLSSLTPMKASKNASKRKSARTSKAGRARPVGKIRIGVESMNGFFSRMRVKARRLDRAERVESGWSVSFEDPADFLEVITPARVSILKELNARTVAIFALAATLSRDPSAIRRDVALLESQHLVRTRKGANPGHGSRTLVERVAGAIKLSATV